MSALKQEYINYRVQKSEETFQDAELLAEHERWNSSMNRIYYSCFYLVSTPLYQEGISAETHQGAKTQFFLKFIKTGLVDKKYGKLYSHLFDWRQDTDYGDFAEFDRETVISTLEKVNEFNKELNKLIKDE